MPIHGGEHVFAGIGIGYQLRFDAATISGGSAQCNLNTSGITHSVSWATSDSWYKEKFSIIHAASLAGKPIWIEFKPQTPGSSGSPCILTYVGTL